jgi:hypothetical protein
MRRRTLDALLATGGLIVAVVFLIASGMLLWASNFIGDNVETQLAAQKVTMPSGTAIEDPLIKPYLSQYAGQQMLTGDQAKAYADHYILVHMNKASGGRTYEEVSGEYIALTKNPNADAAKVQELGDLRQTLFMGNALRSMLLNAYAFGTMATVAMWGAIAAFVAAAAMLVLTFLGFAHMRRAPAHQEVGLGHAAPSPA